MSYITKTDLEDVVGRENVAIWSSINNDQDVENVADLGRVATAILLGEEYIEDRFRESKYAVPFTTVTTRLKMWMATVACWELYKARGIRDVDEEGRPNNRVFNLKKEVDKEIDRVLAGMLKVGLALADAQTDSGSVPTGMEASE